MIGLRCAYAVSPTRPMAVWILRRVIRAPKRAKVKLAEFGR